MSSGSNSALHSIRTHFQTGDYNYLFKLQKEGRVPSEGKEEFMFLLYRSMISTGKSDQVLKEIPSSEDLPEHLLSSRLLASYYLPTGTDSDRAQVVNQLKQLENNPQCSQSLFFHIVEAIILINEENYESALECLYNSPSETLEMYVFSFIIYIFFIISLNISSFFNSAFHFKSRVLLA